MRTRAPRFRAQKTLASEQTDIQRSRASARSFARLPSVSVSAHRRRQGLLTPSKVRQSSTCDDSDDDNDDDDARGTGL